MGSQCEEKTKQKSRNMLSFDKKKKIENETKRKQTLLQLTTYVMCHKLNSDFSKLCLLS